ncbi:type II toxin-antitoxin system death-on-curing family toxin [uncultured Amnibacterium sp.]|uniref:type II toxin-antitoxin system death-on-curing family toxin n=1 Tax=uncultured Amnibacterium sp. TaxID=1631851 RepID=UPI0035CB9024
MDEVVLIHDLRSAAPLIDRGRLEAAVAQPSLELLSGYAYESLFLQAAVLLLHRVAMSHAFADGNKRTAWLACVTFLELNGVAIRDDLSQAEVADFMVSVVADHLDQAAIARWLEGAAAA